MGIIISSLKKSFYSKSGIETAVLSNISLKISSGSCIAIQGKSGAGKSTLLHIIGCLDSQTAGDYFLDDINVTALSAKEKSLLRNTKFGFVMQDYALINDESALDNIMLPAVFSKKNLSIVKERAIKLLADFGMQELAFKKVNMLSGGEKQRVSIIRALINDPNYILADEPTGALDSKNTEDILKIFLDLNKKGKTIIIVTHDDTVAAMCNYIITLSDGMVLEQPCK